jgi:threonine-phosphate decarboxylase
MNIHDFAEQKGFDLRQVIDFVSCANPLGLSNKAKHAIRKGIKHIPFPPDEEIRYLKRYICKRQRIKEDNILFGQGLPNIIHALLHMTSLKTVFAFSPVSYEYRTIFNMYDMKVISVPMLEENGFSIDIERFMECIHNADIIVLPSPHDITGAYLSMENLTRIIVETDRQGKILVIDETYIEFTQSVSPVRQIIESEKAIIFRTFSVFHALSGLPVAYVMGSPGLIKKISDFSLPQQIGTLGYMAALASLKDKGFRERTQRFIKEEKQFIMEKVKGVSTLKIFDTQCNFLLLKIRQPIMDLEDLLLKKNILIDTYTGDEESIYVKMPLKTHKFNARFIKSLRYIINSYKQHSEGDLD